MSAKAKTICGSESFTRYKNVYNNWFFWSIETCNLIYDIYFIITKKMLGLIKAPCQCTFTITTYGVIQSWRFINSINRLFEQKQIE